MIRRFGWMLRGRCRFCGDEREIYAWWGGFGRCCVDPKCLGSKNLDADVEYTRKKRSKS